MSHKISLPAAYISSSSLSKSRPKIAGHRLLLSLANARIDRLENRWRDSQKPNLAIGVRLALQNGSQRGVVTERGRGKQPLT